MLKMTVSHSALLLCACAIAFFNLATPRNALALQNETGLSTDYKNRLRAMRVQVSAVQPGSDPTLRSDPTMRRDGQRQSPRNTGDQSRLELLSIVTRAAQTAGDCPHLQSRLKELAKILSRPNFFRAVSKDSENCRAGSTSAMNTGDHVDICPYSRGATRMNFMLLHESAHSTSYNLAIYRGADCDLVNSSTITRDNISTWDACPGEQDANALAFAALSRAGEGGHDFGKQNYQCNGPSH